MTKKKYEIEKEGQIDFFSNYGIDYINQPILIENTDGVYEGKILEFKLNINDVSKTLFQAIKYLSRLRIKGKSVPSKILLIDLNDTKVYEFNSIDYKNDIQKVYIGAASKGNNNFSGKINIINTYDYSNMVDSDKVKKLLKSQAKYMPIDLDENCIVSWAERYYEEVPTAKKGDFIGDGTGKINLNGEIRDPKHFKGLINPYTQATNEKFKYLMDCLNDRLSKKDLGAFYTPKVYCDKALELILDAINRVPDKNDYIILDRCAGTGNLEASLVGVYDKNGDEIISHCVVSTYEYYEYKVLLERIGDKVRNIIPPTEADVVYENGMISNADAMSEDYINNPLIKQYIDDQNCTIILYENPPYRDLTSGMTGVKSKNKKNQSFVLKEMIKNNISATNELANHFIWSGFNLYLRQPTDSFVLFSPMKYWKLDHLINKKISKGFIFNRNHFHASPSAIGCILFENIEDKKDSYELECFDIENDSIKYITKTTVKRAYNTISSIFDKTKDNNDKESNIVCNGDGTFKIHSSNISLYNSDIVGYLVGRGFGISNPNLNFNLLRTCYYDKHGFYIRKNNYLNYLPIISIKHYLMFERPWYETELVCCSADKGTKYQKDKIFLKYCFIFGILDYYNKNLSFTTPDGTYYKNELCFDDNTIASKDLAKYKLNSDEKKLIELWKQILEEAKKTANYDSNLSYGVYQITKELNTYHQEGTGNNKKNVYDYPILNGYLNSLKDKLKEYYKKYITPKMFKYELIK